MGTRMTDIMLKDLDPGLLDRLQRLAEGQGWPMPQTSVETLGSQTLNRKSVGSSIR